MVLNTLSAVSSGVIAAAFVFPLTPIWKKKKKKEEEECEKEGEGKGEGGGGRKKEEHHRGWGLLLIGLE